MFYFRLLLLHPDWLVRGKAKAKVNREQLLKMLCGQFFEKTESKLQIVVNENRRMYLCRENFGTNPDHVRNILTNCGIRQPEYGDRRIHYWNTRKRGM